MENRQYRKTNNFNQYRQVTKEELTNQIKDAAEQLADLLMHGYQLELSTSRKGFQVYKMQKSHQVIYKNYDPVKEQEKYKG